MIRVGWKTRELLMFCLVVFHATASLADWGVKIEATNINTGKKLYNRNTLHIMAHDIVGIEIIGYFYVDSNSHDYIGKFKKVYKSYIPGYVEGWKDSSFVLPSGEDTTRTLRTVIYIHPEKEGTDSIWVESVMTPPKGYSRRDRMKLKIYVHKSRYGPPIILKEPVYTRGLSNTIFWIPSLGRKITIQDAYCFDVEDRENLQNSLRRLYRVSQKNKVQSEFENLKDGHKYGYFVKAIYDTGSGLISLHSRIVYSTQDNSPPEKILKPEVDIDADGKIVIWWNPVKDSFSGLAKYNIYRAIDTESEILIDSVSAESVQENSLLWMDTTIDSGFTYYYRIRAVDQVGNEGDGERSNGVFLSEDGEKLFMTEDITEEDTNFIYTNSNFRFRKGCVDTVWVELDGREKRIRFEAVRDKISYFDNSPDLPMRYFDSDWLRPDTLQSDPINPNRKYWNFDYSYNSIGNFYIDGNFVNNHTYIRRVIREYIFIVDTTLLGEVIPDCFPPDDIHNLKVQAIIDDSNFQDPSSGYTNWYMKLKWNSARDGASGLKCYHIYRKIEGVNNDFEELALLADTFYTDTTLHSISNPIVFYRVVAEDSVGNCRDVQTSNWEAYDRALGAPTLTACALDFQTTKNDTIYTMKDTVVFQLEDFNISEVEQFFVSVNGDEQFYELNKNQDALVVILPKRKDQESVVINTLKVRALYSDKRSSVWSLPKIVIRVPCIPPAPEIQAYNSSDWNGYIFLKWYRPSIDARYYIISRSSKNEDWCHVDTVYSNKKTIVWWDSCVEIGNSFCVYKMYHYRVQMVNLLDWKSDFSNIDSTYCNRSPNIIPELTQITEADGDSVNINICWQRARPTLVKKSFITYVWIYEDRLNNEVKDDVVTDDDTCYTYYGAELGHNYIFRIQEIPNDDPIRRQSSLSQQYTASLKNLRMSALTQPMGHIYIQWDSTIVDTLDVVSFRLRRFANEGSSWVPLLDTLLSNVVFAYMDSAQFLVHKKPYKYSLTALDRYTHMLAAKDTEEVFCDKGSVFIPEIGGLSRYFNSDFIDLCWFWKDIDGIKDTTTTRGADSCLVQVSVSKDFPSIIEGQTVEKKVQAHPSLRCTRLSIPKHTSITNRKVYVRITAWDQWGNPSKIIWSTYFDSTLKMSIYDPFPAMMLDTLFISSVKSYYGNSDSVIVKLQWQDNSLINKDSLVSNVEVYKVMRLYDGIESTAGYKQIKLGSVNYTFTDMVINREHQWRVVTIDSAGNETSSNWVEPVCFVPTPDPPHPTGFKKCIIQPLDSDSVEYFLEIAVDPNHFKLAYEMGMNNMGMIEDILLCRSDWIGAEDTFECKSGWGSIKTDTTWFRVKARKMCQDDTVKIESGWSEVVYYTPKRGGKEKAQHMVETPTCLDVQQNFPNPFNAETAINYQLPEIGSVDIRIYNAIGSIVRILVNEDKPAGHYTVVWNGSNDRGLIVSSGIYFVRVIMKTKDGGSFQKIMKLMMMK